MYAWEAKSSIFPHPMFSLGTKEFWKKNKKKDLV
jgi:hypothetical protein